MHLSYHNNRSDSSSCSGDSNGGSGSSRQIQVYNLSFWATRALPLATAVLLSLEGIRSPMEEDDAARTADIVLPLVSTGKKSDRVG